MPEYSCINVRIVQEVIPLQKFILSMNNTKIDILMLLKLMHNKIKYNGSHIFLGICIEKQVYIMKKHT